MSTVINDICYKVYVVEEPAIKEGMIGTVLDDKADREDYVEEIH